MLKVFIFILLILLSNGVAINITKMQIQIKTMGAPHCHQAQAAARMKTKRSVMDAVFLSSLHRPSFFLLIGDGVPAQVEELDPLGSCA